MHIFPVREAGQSKTGELVGVTYADICEKLGFEPNCTDDPDKVKHSWGFVAVRGPNLEISSKCGVWDYYGSDADLTWSTYGADAVFASLFGSAYVARV